MSIVYDHPRYYEIAFSFRDIPREVDVFEECIRRYARVPVHSFLELACGNSPHMTEILSRSYRYIGVDLNDQMLTFGRQKVTDSGRATLLKADMCGFSLEQSAEFAYVALGSLFAQGTTDLLTHFQSVARALPTGGLYFLDACVSFSSMHQMEERWEVEQQGISVTTTVSGRVVDPTEQLYEESIALEVVEDDARTKVSGTDLRRIMYPQEFLLFVRHCTDFDFLGWWNDWNLEDPLPSRRPINRPITLLRRR